MDNQTQTETLSVTMPEASVEAGEASRPTDAQPHASGGEEVCEAAESQAEGGEAGETPEPQLTVRYNHQNRTLSLTEAKELAQKGLKLDSMSEMLNDLSYLAAIQNKKPAELIKHYIEAGEALKRRELTEQYGEGSEAVEALMEKYITENRRRLTLARDAEAQFEADAEQDANRRIADDFRKMRGEFSELSDYAALPDEVKAEALSGVPLKYAYLDYLHRQEVEKKAAGLTAAAAAGKSAGSLSGGEDARSPESALLRGLWR